MIERLKAKLREWAGNCSGYEASHRDAGNEVEAAYHMGAKEAFDRCANELPSLLGDGEPVAWKCEELDQLGNWDLALRFHHDPDDPDCRFWEPLYLHPPREPDRKGGDELNGWQVWRNQTCVECPSCGFLMGAEHTDEMGDGDGGYSCPNCEITLRHLAHPREREGLARSAFMDGWDAAIHINQVVSEAASTKMSIDEWNRCKDAILGGQDEQG